MRGIGGANLRLCNIKVRRRQNVREERYTKLGAQMEGGETEGELPGPKTVLTVQGMAFSASSVEGMKLPFCFFLCLTSRFQEHGKE